MKPKMCIVFSQYPFSCRAGMDFYRTQKALKGMLKIRHEKNKVDTFDPKLFREKLEDSS